MRHRMRRARARRRTTPAEGAQQRTGASGPFVVPSNVASGKWRDGIGPQAVRVHARSDGTDAISRVLSRLPHARPDEMTEAEGHGCGDATDDQLTQPAVPPAAAGEARDDSARAEQPQPGE